MLLFWPWCDVIKDFERKLTLFLWLYSYQLSRSIKITTELTHISGGRDLMESKQNSPYRFNAMLCWPLSKKKGFKCFGSMRCCKSVQFLIKMNSQHSTEVLSVSIQLLPSLCAVNSSPRCFLNQNTLLAHRLGLFSFLLQFRNLHSHSTLSIPSIGNLSALHLRHPIPGRQLHRVLNKHKQRMEWLLEREMAIVIGLPDRGSRESQVLWIVGLELSKDKKRAYGDHTEGLRYFLRVNKIIVVAIENKKMRGREKEGHTGQILWSV